MKFIEKLLIGIALFSFVMGVLAMFAAKIATYEGGMFLFRVETHWFNDSITALLVSLNLLAFVFLIKKK